MTLMTTTTTTATMTTTTTMLIAMMLAPLLACGGDGAECTVPEGVEPDWTRTLGCASDFELLWDQRDDAIFARTHTINWLIDTEDTGSGDERGRLYFIDSRTFDLHYFFASAYLEIVGRTPVGTHDEFNQLNYRRANRRFILGKLITYSDQQLVTLEFSAGDTADADMIAAAYDQVADAIYNGDELVYRPVSARQEALTAELVDRIPVIRTAEVFSGQTYQPLEQGVGYGTLRFRRVAELGGQPLSPTDLVVLDRVPNDIAMVSGIITDEFQTPLSHINILSKNRGTPNMALRDGFDDPVLRGFEGQLVRLEVGPQDYAIRAAAADEAQAYFDGLRPSQALVPDFDLSVTGIVDLGAASASDSRSVGAKAANLGEMTAITTTAGMPIPLPDQPFAVPFAHYAEHLAAHQIAPMIDQLLADVAAGPLEPDELARRLFAIRWAIFTAPLDPALEASLEAAIRTRWGEERRARFRSSTNVEDLPEFSGAGLYTSAGASLGEGPGAVADAIKVVWASAWNRQAFVERDFYRVDHARVQMAVLIHPSFTDEQANGVAITINERNERRPAYFINSQVGEVSVTNPTGLAIPEQILYYTWYEEPEYEVITRSSLLGDATGWPGGDAVFTDAELDELASYLAAIHGHFRTIFTPGAGFAMDVEFKLDRERRVVIKQARPVPRRGL